MVTLEQRISFAERHIKNKEGHKFSLRGRDWVKEEFWGPCDGWKLWPVKADKLCRECKGRAGEIVQYDEELIAELREHAFTTKGCEGLDLNPIVLTVLNLGRRAGKTFSTAAYLLSTILTQPYKSITFIATSEDQAGDLFEENYLIPIRSNAKLLKLVEIKGNRITSKKTGSFIEYIPTALGSNTGRGRTHIVIDEARTVRGEVVAQLMPSVFAHHGLECPVGQNRRHTHCQATEDAPTHCAVCGEKLVPWHARIMITSSSGMIDSELTRWFAELVEQLEKAPDQNCHLFRADSEINPDIDQVSKGMLERVFAPLNSMRELMDVELNNDFRRKGEDFVSRQHVAACTKRHLRQIEGCEKEAFAYLDTSRSGDLTSLVFVTREEEHEAHPWEIIAVSRIDLWDPKKQPLGVIEKGIIRAHLEQYIPLWPNLIRCLVDVRGGMSWAFEMVTEMRKECVGWGKKLISHRYGHTAERDAAWGHAESRLLNGKLWLPPPLTLEAKRLHEEIMAVRRVTRPDGTVEIRDRNRKKKHADAIESVVWCCDQVYKHQTRPRTDIGALNTKSTIARILDRKSRPRSAGLSVGGF